MMVLRTLFLEILPGISFLDILLRILLLKLLLRILLLELPLRILFLEMVLRMESAESYRILKESTAKLYKDEEDSGDHGETNTDPTMSTMQEKKS